MAGLIEHQQIEDLARIMNLKYAPYRKDRYFSLRLVEGVWVEIKVTLSSLDKTFVYPIEAKFESQDKDKTKAERQQHIFAVLDYIDQYFEEYFKEDENVFIPIDWSLHSWEGHEFYLKGQVVNEKLETMAERWIHDHSQECCDQNHD